MPPQEPAVRVTLSQVYELLLETSSAVKEVQQQMNSGNFETRLSALEEAKWKLTGMAGVIGGVASFFVGKMHLK